MDELIQEIIDDLLAEISLSDNEFDKDILTSKVKQAYREVKAERRYPSGYSQSMIDSDMDKYYSHIRNIALYDYNQVGIEFQQSDSENSRNRSFTDRRNLFSGIYPLSRF